MYFFTVKTAKLRTTQAWCQLCNQVSHNILSSILYLLLKMPILRKQILTIQKSLACLPSLEPKRIYCDQILRLNIFQICLQDCTMCPSSRFCLKNIKVTFYEKSEPFCLVPVRMYILVYFLKMFSEKLEVPYLFLNISSFF